MPASEPASEDDRDIEAVLHLAGLDLPPERVAAAAPLVRAMASAARRLERLHLTEAP